jgi:hypothetical protein
MNAHLSSFPYIDPHMDDHIWFVISREMVVLLVRPTKHAY